jgi:hypothetical protein
VRGPPLGGGRNAIDQLADASNRRPGHHARRRRIGANTESNGLDAVIGLDANVVARYL